MNRLIPAGATATAMAAAARRGRRLRSIAVGILVALLLAFGAKLLVDVVSNAAGRSALGRQDYAGAQSWFENNLALNWFSPWLAHYNNGVALYYQQNWKGAQAQFEKALPLAPDSKKCTVAMNLSWTLEAKGDSLKQIGDTPNAALAWGQAKDVAKRAKCDNSQQPKKKSEPSDRDKGSQAQQKADTESRLQSKITQAGAQQQANEQQNESSQTPSQKLDQLQKGNQAAQRQEQQNRDSQDSSPAHNKGDQSW
jgi:tetratricopeptide (TPR) repeat protein